MKAVRYSFYQVVREARSDLMLFIVCFVPFLAGGLFRFGIPALEKLVTSYFHKEQIIYPYYGLVDGFLSILSSIMLCFVSAMIVLEEKDSGIEKYMTVTPVGKAGYFISHFAIPAGIGGVVSMIALCLFHLSQISVSKIIILCLLAAPCGLVCGLIIVMLAGNKVEGMAISKLSGLIMFAIVVPYVVKGNLQYVCAFIPSFWLGRYVLYEDWISAVMGIVVSSVWIVVSMHLRRNRM